MKNVKVSFHHPNFIYNFKVDLTIPYKPQLLGFNYDYEQIQQKFEQIRSKQLFVTTEQAKMLDTLSVQFKRQFIKQYQKIIAQRKTNNSHRNIINTTSHQYRDSITQNIQSNDYLGESVQQHYQYFYLKLCGCLNQNGYQEYNQSIAFRYVKQIYIYINRTKYLTIQKKQEVFQEFYNHRLFEQLTRVVQDHRDYSWNKGQAYTFYYCLMNIASTLMSGLSHQQNLMEIHKFCSHFSVLCFKQSKNHLKFSLLTEISEQFFKIWNIRSQLSPNNGIWLYQSIILNPNQTTKLIDLILLFLGSQFNNNMAIHLKILSFLDEIRQNCLTMNQLLTFITTCINQKILNTIDKIYEKYRLGNYKIRDTTIVSIPEDISENFGKKPIRLKQKEFVEGKWNKMNKQAYKIVIILKSKFEQFKSGKVLYQKKKNITLKEEHQKAKQEVEMHDSFQKYQRIYLHNQFEHKQNQIISQITSENIQFQEQLKTVIHDNEELTKVNKWYEELVNQKANIIRELEEAVAQFVNVKQRYISDQKLKHCSNLNPITILPKKPTLNIRQSLKITSSKISLQTPQESQSLHFLKQLNPILPPPPPIPQYLRSSTKSKRNSHSSSQHQRLNLLPPPPPQIALPPQFTLPPPPPPIPLFNMASQKLKNTEQVKVTAREIKTVNWSPVEMSKVKDSFWDGIQEVTVDEQQLVKFFSKNPPPQQKNKIQTESFIKIKKSILNSARAKNIQIVLKKIKVPISSIPEAIQYLDDNILSLVNIESLLNILPTDKQIEQYSQVVIPKGQDIKQEWNIADYFFLTVIQISNFQQTLKAMRFKYQFAEISKSYKKNISQFIQYFSILEGDAFLKEFFIEMLSIGNFMNRDNTKGNAYGFRFESIEKTYSLSDSANNFTLFQFIMKSMHKRGVKFPKFESGYYKKGFIVPIQILRDDLNELRRMCQNVQECLLRSDEDDQTVATCFLAFYIEVREQITLLDQKFNIAYKILKGVADFYCEKLETQKIVSIINQFRGRVRKYVQKNRYILKDT